MRDWRRVVIEASRACRVAREARIAFNVEDWDIVVVGNGTARVASCVGRGEMPLFWLGGDIERGATLELRCCSGRVGTMWGEVALFGGEISETRFVPSAPIASPLILCRE